MKRSSVAWSIVPDQSWRGALQITAIFAACIVVLGIPLPSDQARETIARLMPVAFAAGAVIICADAATGYHLQSIVAGGKFTRPTKYNQGADYLVLVAWPLIAQASDRRRWLTVLVVAASTALMLALALSVTGRIAALAGAVVLGTALLSRRIVARGLAAASVILAGLTPVLLHSLAEHRAFIAGHILVNSHLRRSGLARLDLWSYMSARVFERPLRGWGLWSSKLLPISPAELSRYHGNYPHNQWLQLWVETGGLGPTIALVAALIVLARCKSLAGSFQPFAYAAFASALVISVADFQMTTDSWWAALAASAYLFKALSPRTLVISPVTPSPHTGKLSS